eukprot:2269827-Rhodomonas_salina.4
MKLRTCYALPGTDLAYAATDLAYAATSLTHLLSDSNRTLYPRWPGELRYLPTRVLCDARYWPSGCCYLRATIPCTQLAHGATHWLRDARVSPRARYYARAMRWPGSWFSPADEWTPLSAWYAICLRLLLYAMCGTELAYVATRSMSRADPHAMPGAPSAMPCPVPR